MLKKRRQNTHKGPSRQTVIADLRHAVKQELKDPWGRINCGVGIILIFLVIADLSEGLLVSFGVDFHWKFISIVFSLHGAADSTVTVVLLALTVFYWMFCINSFKQLRQ
jgi:hypothetical protein